MSNVEQKIGVNNFEQKYAGTNEVPAITSAENLSVLRLLGQLGNQDFGNDPEDKALKAIVMAETKYLKASALAIKSDPKLQHIFGQGLEGASNFARVLQQYDSEAATRRLLEPWLPRSEEVGKNGGFTDKEEKEAGMGGKPKAPKADADT